VCDCVVDSNTSLRLPCATRRGGTPEPNHPHSADTSPKAHRALSQPSRSPLPPLPPAPRTCCCSQIVPVPVLSRAVLYYDKHICDCVLHTLGAPRPKASHRHDGIYVKTVTTGSNQACRVRRVPRHHQVSYPTWIDTLGSHFSPEPHSSLQARDDSIMLTASGRQWLPSVVSNRLRRCGWYNQAFA
jgi:hypothetical protein